MESSVLVNSGELGVSQHRVSIFVTRFEFFFL